VLDTVGHLNNFQHFIKNGIFIYFYERGTELTLFLSTKNIVSYIIT
jgi:hypothetical protein